VPPVSTTQGTRVRRAAALQGEIQRKNADSKSLNSPYKSLTPILSQGNSDVEMEVADDLSTVPAPAVSQMKDPVLVCNVLRSIIVYSHVT
jgi:hypothetical protein